MFLVNRQSEVVRLADSICISCPNNEIDVSTKFGWCPNKSVTSETHARWQRATFQDERVGGCSA